MARRAAAIGLQREQDPDLLLLSAGDFYADPGIRGMYRSRFLTSMMVKMGYGAVAVGERELSFGLRSLREGVESGLPLICANLYIEGERAFPPSTVLELKGRNIGIFALLGEEPREPGELELREPAAEGTEVLERLEESCDLVILLAHMSRDKLVSLLPKLEGVDIVIRGHGLGGERASAGCVDTLGGLYENLGVDVLYPGDRGKSIGLVRVSLLAGTGPRLVNSTLINLGADVVEDADLASLAKQFYHEENERMQKARLTEFFSRDAVKGRIRERYLGMEVCRRCHMELMPDFLVGRHFRAFDVIEEQGMENNADCLACHTTGHGRFTGYDPESEKKGGINLRGVQCEACHGPGTLHSRDGAYSKAAKRSCRACHTPKWSPDFDFETYWKRDGHRTREGRVTRGS